MFRVTIRVTLKSFQKILLVLLNKETLTPSLIWFNEVHSYQQEFVWIVCIILVIHLTERCLLKNFGLNEVLVMQLNSSKYSLKVFWCCDVDISYFFQWFSFVIVFIYSFVIIYCLFVCYPQSHFWINVVCAFNLIFCISKS